MAVAAKAFTSMANLGWGFDAFGLTIDVGFDVVLVEAAAAPGVTLTVEGIGTGQVPASPQQNTAGLALLALLERHAAGRGLHAVVCKGVRHGSGMGSSAASAAAAVLAANVLMNLNLTPTQMVECAAEGERAAAGTAHADNVAPALLGGFTIVEKGPPLTITRLPAPADLRLAVVTPEIVVPTSVARQRMPKEISLGVYAQGAARCGAIVAAILTNDMTALGRAVEGSFTDAARGPLIPGYDAVCAAARSAGAAGVTISGAGPTVAAIVQPGADADAVVRAMVRAFHDAGLQSDGRVARPAPGAEILEAVP